MANAGSLVLGEGIIPMLSPPSIREGGGRFHPATPERVLDPPAVTARNLGADDAVRSGRLSKPHGLVEYHGVAFR